MPLPKLPNHIVIGRFRPEQGTEPGEMKIPGPGTYEADFHVPDWLVPDLDTSRKFDVNVRGNKITHLATSIRGTSLSVRFKVTEIPEPTTQSPETEAVIIGLTLAVAIKALLGVTFGTLAALIIKGIVDSVREVRKLVELPAGGVLAVGGATLLAGFGIFLGVKAIRGG